MRKNLLLMLAFTSTCFSLSSLATQTDYSAFNKLIAELGDEPFANVSPLDPLNQIKILLQSKAASLNELVIDKVLATLKCAGKYTLNSPNILTIIDYSLPSSKKRLWVFDLKARKLLFYTYVSHGIKSGVLTSTYFSNTYDSKASSIGVYATDKAYYGREGISLKLEGLEKSFNDNAFNRSVVMHGGWYVEKQFIKKYGRAGRSWGCPAVPLNISAPLIQTIKDKSLFVIYYPSDNWFLKSKFLNCKARSSPIWAQLEADVQPIYEQKEGRENILFADINNNNKREENEPIIVISADNYERIFLTKAPLERMLRRQINNLEYIALSNYEFNSLITSNFFKDQNNIKTLYFVIPVIKMSRGYYLTEMHIQHLGLIKQASFNQIVNLKPQEIKSYTVYLDEKPAITVKATNHFIRWLGL